MNQGCKVINRSRGIKWKYRDDKGKLQNRISSNNKPISLNTGIEFSDDFWKEIGIDAAQAVLRLLEEYGKDFLLVNAAGNDGVEAIYSGWICSITEECAEEAVRIAGKDCGYTAQDILDVIIVVGSVEKNAEYGNINFIRDGNLVVPADCERTLVMDKDSDYGKTVTVCAPGNDIYSTIDHRAWFSDYSEDDGTSWAAPIVAACAAQVWSIDPSMSPDEVKECLVSTAIEGVRTGSDKDDTGASYSMVNLKDAVESVLLRKGYISETRPDGDLKKIAQKIAYSKFMEGEEEIERLFDRYMDQLNAGDYAAAFETMNAMVKEASDYQIYGFFYILAELL